jgi:protein-S-isoprenylcysteine O-methyltransferase Ste14
MKSDMDIWGIGPRIAISGILSFAATLITGLKAEHPVHWFVPGILTAVPGTALLVAGIYFWLDAVRLISTRFKSGVLITEGVYRFVRNPMYAGFIVFIVPGISLILNDPLIILSSIVMLLVFKMNIHKEEQYLEQRFGHAYRDYMAKVKQIIPCVW